MFGTLAKEKINSRLVLSQWFPFMTSQWAAIHTNAFTEVEPDDRERGPHGALLRLLQHQLRKQTQVKHRVGIMVLQVQYGDTVLIPAALQAPASLCVSTCATA